MSTEAVAGTAPAAPAAPVLSPAAPAPAPAPTPAAKPDSSEYANRVSKAQGPRGVQQLLAEALKPAAPKAPPPDQAPDGNETPAPAAAPAPETPAEPAAAEPVKPAEGDAPAEPAPEATPEATPEPAPAAPEPPDDEVTPIEGSRARLKGITSEVDKLAVSFKRRNQDWSLEECVAAAKEQLGVKPAADPSAKPEAPKPVGSPDLPQSVAAVDSAIEQLEADLIQAGKDLDPGKQAEIQIRIRRLDRQRSTLETRDQQAVADQEAQRATQYDTQFVASEQRAAEFYPDAAKPDSDFGKRMVEIEADLRSLNDPMYYSPDKPLRIAQMVAAERNIAPRKPGSKAPAPAAKPAAPVAPKAAPKGILPTGGSKTAPAATANPVVEQLSKVRTSHDIEKIMRGLGKKDF